MSRCWRISFASCCVGVNTSEISSILNDGPKADEELPDFGALEVAILEIYRCSPSESVIQAIQPFSGLARRHQVAREHWSGFKRDALPSIATWHDVLICA